MVRPRIVHIPPANTVLSGEDPPDDATGQDGDFYIDGSYNIYGPKEEGQWPESTSLIGPSGSEASVYTHSQSVASTLWVINHDLHYFPNVTTVTSAGDTVEGDVQYLSADSIQIHFAASVGGFAYLS